MLVVYKTIPAKEIRKDAREAIEKVNAWFASNKKRICRAQLWYGKVVDVRRGHVEEDINTAAKAAIAGGKRKT